MSGAHATSTGDEVKLKELLARHGAVGSAVAVLGGPFGSSLFYLIVTVLSIHCRSFQQVQERNI